MRRRYKYALYGISILATLYIAATFLHKASFSRSEYRFRVFKLWVWRTKMMEHVEHAHAVPDRLYDYCVSVNGVWYTKVSILNSEHRDTQDVQRILGSPTEFEAEVEYELLKGGTGWYIKEKNGGHYFKDMLMVDCRGTIYTVMVSGKDECDR
jgi:hypothetical protein